TAQARPHPDQTRLRRPGLLRPAAHEQRTYRSRERSPRAPAWPGPRLPQPHQLHRPRTPRSRRIQTTPTPRIVKSHIDGVRNPGEASAIGCADVRFTPGARTVWHTHPKGQTLYVTDGIGLVGTENGVQEIRPGDVAVIEPGERHWH